MGKQTIIETLPVAEIVPAKDNPRRKVGDVTELADSIKTIGLLEPLVVMPQNGHYLLVCGERRLAGAKKAGVKEVPAIVREFDERERIEAMLIENLQREDLAPLEEAEAFSRLVELGHTQRELGKRVGRSQSHVAKRLALLKLPADVQTKVDSGGITLEDAVALTRLVEYPERLKALLRRPNHYYFSIPRQVETELEEIEKERKFAAAVKKAQGEGLRVIPQAGSDHYWYRPPKGVLKIAKSPNDWESLPLDPKAHAKEPCHAVGIEPRTLERIPLCTDRKRHPKAKTANEKSQASSSNGSSAAHSQYEKERLEREQVAEARHAFIRELLAKKPPKDVLELLQRALVRTAEYGEDAGLAAQLLGLEPPDEDSSPWDWAGDALIEFGSRGEAERAKAAAALAFAFLDQSQLGSHYNLPADGGEGAAYLGWLERHGYELRPAERKMLAKKAAA